MTVKFVRCGSALTGPRASYVLFIIAPSQVRVRQGAALSQQQPRRAPKRSFQCQVVAHKLVHELAHGGRPCPRLLAAVRAELRPWWPCGEAAVQAAAACLLAACIQRLFHFQAPRPRLQAAPWPGCVRRLAAYCSSGGGRRQRKSQRASLRCTLCRASVLPCKEGLPMKPKSVLVLVLGLFVFTLAGARPAGQPCQAPVDH